MENKACQNCKKDFQITPEDFEFYNKIKVPPPTFCPDCRLQRRMASRNERTFHRSECVMCKQSIISIYNNDSRIVVYCPTCWWSDKWDPYDYGREYDFNKNFFTQYDEFKKTVPHESLYQSNFVNSDYANFGFNYKDCYLVSGGWDNERLYYASQVNNILDSLDILRSNNLEFCFESIQCKRSSKLKYCLACEDSNDLFMCTDCRGCISCFGCVGLQNKQHCVFNKQYSKDDYENLISTFKFNRGDSIDTIKEKCREFALTMPYKSSRFRNAVNCTGDSITNSKNARHSFSVEDVEDVKYTFFLNGNKDTYDCTYIGKGGERQYEVISSFGGADQIVGVRVLFCTNVLYSEDCHNCDNIFGCIGLKQKSYCIFNKQYTKEEYEILKDKIVDQMIQNKYLDKIGREYSFGDFWPIELQPFPYNETKAQENFSISKVETENLGYKWKDGEDRNYQIKYTANDLSNTIDEIPNDILESIIGCEHDGNCKDNCTTGFKILEGELEIYKRLNLPIPKLCPNCRHMARIKEENPPQLWRRSCMNTGCTNEFETSYSPERPEKVYCESCYNKEIY